MSAQLRLALSTRARHAPAPTSTQCSPRRLGVLHQCGKDSRSPGMPGRKTGGTVATAMATHGGSDGGGQGARAAEQLVDNAEEGLEQLEKRVWSKQAEAHLGPALSMEGEPACIWYFAYGSNINKKVFEGRRMIKPAESLPAVLPGWRLTFSQPGLPFSEPAFAAVERHPTAVTDAGQAGSGNGWEAQATVVAGALEPHPQWDVHGVVHRITPSQWRYVMETEGASESSGSGKEGEGEEQDDARGYAVVEATAVTYDGRQLPGVKTLTVPARLKARMQGRDALPSLRYLTLIREGAADYGLHPEYRAWLDTLQHYEAVRPGQKLGSVLFKFIAFSTIFPVWAAARLFRRFTGMQAANGDVVSRFMGRYTAFAFGSVHLLHEVLRPVLGCGMTAAAGGAAAEPKKLQ